MSRLASRSGHPVPAQVRRGRSPRTIDRAQSPGTSELEELKDWEAPALAFTDDEVEVLAELEHRRWLAYQKRISRSRGRLRQRLPVPGTEDLVDWGSLPAPEQDIDRAFVRALPGLLAQLGYHVVRRPG